MSLEFFEPYGLISHITQYKVRQPSHLSLYTLTLHPYSTEDLQSRIPTLSLEKKAKSCLLCPVSCMYGLP